MERKRPPRQQLFDASLSRRRVFQIGGLGLASAVLGGSQEQSQYYSPSSSDRRGIPHQQPQKGETSDSNPERTKSPHAEQVNLLSAMGVAGTFFGMVGSVAAKKKPFEKFGPKTVGVMAGIEALRLAALDATDSEKFKEEIKGLEISALTTGILSIVCEFASNAKISAEDLSPKRPEHDEAIDFKRIPSLRESPQEKVEKDLVYTRERITSLAAETMGAAAVLGPISTSYVSCSAAAQATIEMTQLLTRANYQQKMLEQKQTGQVLTTDQEKTFYEDAVKDAFDKINGIGGWNHLMIAFASNAFSNGLIGGPPAIASLIDTHSWQHLYPYSTEGLGYAELLSSFALTQWLASTETLDSKKQEIFPKVFGNFWKSQLKAIAEVAHMATTKRNVAFRAGSKYLPEVQEKLEALLQEKNPENLSFLLQVIRDIPDPLISIDFAEMYKQKKEAFPEVLKKFKPVINKVFNQDSQETLLDESVEEEGDKIVKRFTGIISRAIQLANKTTSVTEFTEEHVSHVFDMKDFSTFVDYIPGTKGTEQETSKAKRNFIKTILTKGFQQVEETGFFEEHGFFSKETKEQFYALCTQLSAVPALVELANAVISKSFKLMDHASNETKIRTLFYSVLAIEAILSSSADNVAALKFARGVIEENLQKILGSDWKEKHKSLANFMNLSTLLMAVWGGAHSKIGNGASFVLKNTNGTIDFDETEKEVSLNLKNSDITLLESYANKYAFEQTGLGSLMLLSQLELALAA